MDIGMTFELAVDLVNRTLGDCVDNPVEEEEEEDPGN